MFSSVFCSVFNSEHVRHFVRLLFVFGVRVLFCSCSCSDQLFCSVRCSGLDVSQVGLAPRSDRGPTAV